MNYEGMKVKVPSGNIGTIKSYQEKSITFAEGFYIKFEDYPIDLFIPKECCEIQYDENNLDQEDNQIKFNL